MIKILKNNYDDVTFEDLKKAKRYYIPKWNEKEERENFICNIYGGDFEWYKENFYFAINDLLQANSLEELAEGLNRFSCCFRRFPQFGNNRVWTVEVIE